MRISKILISYVKLDHTLYSINYGISKDLATYLPRSSVLLYSSIMFALRIYTPYPWLGELYQYTLYYNNLRCISFQLQHTLCLYLLSPTSSLSDDITRDILGPLRASTYSSSLYWSKKYKLHVIVIIKFLFLLFRTPSYLCQDWSHSATAVFSLLLSLLIFLPLSSLPLSLTLFFSLSFLPSPLLNWNIFTTASEHHWQGNLMQRRPTPLL